MKKKQIIALACVLALVVSLMSSFTYAAVPEAEVEVAEAGDNARALKHYVVEIATYMYSEPHPYSPTAYPNKLPVGTNLVRVDSQEYNGVWYKMQYGSYVGYILRTRLTEVQ